MALLGLDGAGVVDGQQLRGVHGDRTGHLETGGPRARAAEVAFGICVYRGLGHADTGDKRESGIKAIIG